MPCSVQEFKALKAVTRVLLVAKATAALTENNSSTVAPNADYSHGEASETNSSSYLLKGLGGLDSLLDCFAVDVILVQRGK